MVRIDCQSHVYPRAFFEILARNKGLPLARLDHGKTAVQYDHIPPVFLREEAFDLPRKLAAMDYAGIDVALISHVIPGPCVLVPELAEEGARAVNDYIAELVQQYPHRFVGLACIPWQDAAVAIREMDRAQQELGLRGIVLYSHVNGRPVDDPTFEPIFAHAAARGLPIVLHPAVPTWAQAIQDHWMIQMLGFPVDASVALLRLILGGVLERHARLQVLMPHGGGVLPYLMGRIEHHVEGMRSAQDRITQPPSTYFRQIYLDTAIPSAESLAYACQFSGPERLVFATDHPWGDLAWSVELVENLPISPQAKARIFGQNAAALFGLH